MSRAISNLVPSHHPSSRRCVSWWTYERLTVACRNATRMCGPTPSRPTNIRSPRFVASSAQALPGTYSAGQQVTFPLAGDLTLHGVTRPASFSVTGQLANNTLTGMASATIHLQDFAMKPPQTTAVVKITVSDDILLKINFTATTGSCAATSQLEQRDASRRQHFSHEDGIWRQQ